jgi:alkanesulfonate monooxygenase SsuD/methylene tetrahydromethanopterin reductase-like flavin-dependent oxidoreductase (luciferase family)
VQFFGLHQMPYPFLPESHRTSDASSWVTLSNALFDPERGGRLMNEYLDEYVYYDEMGFDGISVNEHHQTPYGLMPAPNVVAGMLIPRTKCKVAILGNAISLRDHPMRVAEEIAVLDCVSGGRIISGFVRGIGGEYHSFSIDPNTSRERFLEAHDLIVKSWSERGPFEWYGKHFKLRYVNPWPRPIQQPHPPVWSPSQGGTETVAWAAERGYTYLQTFAETKVIARAFSMYRELAEKAGRTVTAKQLAWSVPIFVADTDAEARRIAGEQLDFLFNTLIRMPKEMFYPAGYLSEASAQRVMSAKAGLGTSTISAEDLMDRGYAMVGSPETIRDRFAQLQSEMGFGTIAGVFHFGAMTKEDFRKSVTLFSEKVMPALRPLGEDEPAEQELVG